MANPYSKTQRHKAGFPGSAYEAQNEELDFTNANPQKAQTSIVTLAGTYASGNTVTVNVDDSTVTVTAAGAPVAAIATLLVDAINQNIGMATSVVATSAAGVVTITGRIPGEAFTVTSSNTGAGTSVTTAGVTAAKADPIPFGRVVVRGGASVVSPYPNRLGKLPAAAGEVDSDKALCISLMKYDEPGTGYAPNSRCAGVKRGSVVVEIGDPQNSGSIVDGGVVNVGANGVILVNASSSTALNKSVATFRKYLGDGLAVVDCNFH